MAFCAADDDQSGYDESALNLSSPNSPEGRCKGDLKTTSAAAAAANPQWFRFGSRSQSLTDVLTVLSWFVHTIWQLSQFILRETQELLLAVG